MDVVDAMLEEAEVVAADTVYDLGCGDGRIVVQAAKRHGARGIGVELDPFLACRSQMRVVSEGVAGRVEIHLGDAMAADLTPATVVALYLPTEANLKLRPILERLRTGARVVCQTHPVPGWTPTRVRLLRDSLGKSHPIYLYSIGPRGGATGTWCWCNPASPNFAGTPHLRRMRLRDDGGRLLGELEGRAPDPRGPWDPGTLAGEVRGGAFAFIAVRGLEFKATIDRDTMRGVAVQAIDPLLAEVRAGAEPSAGFASAALVNIGPQAAEALTPLIRRLGEERDARARAAIVSLIGGIGPGAGQAGVPVVAFNVDDHATPCARLAAVAKRLYEAGRTLGLRVAPHIPPRSRVLLTLHDAGISPPCAGTRPPEARLPP